MDFSVLTFGCKVNKGESENIISNMIEKGFKFAGSKNTSAPDIVIINSCTVTAESDRKLRQCIHRVKKENENSVVVLTGCMPQAFPQAAKELPDVDIVVGNERKAEIPDFIEKYLETKTKIFEVSEIRKVTEFKETAKNSSKEKFRAFLKIEDGCDRFCSYCIIPYARGRVRSKPLDEIERDVRNLCEKGYEEIVLTGINLSSYGKDLNCSLEDATQRICSIEGVKRLRLGSLEPDLVTEKLIDSLAKEKKFCPQFHLSLQSGSDKILEKMRRKYTRQQYLDVVKLIKRKIPLATFTTDIMVGFAGETEEDFNESLDIISQVGFLKVHVFPYSIRPGTLAANFDGQISKATKTKRVQKMIDTSQKISRIVIESFLNLKLEVLYESYAGDGFYRGYTKNYIPVKTKSAENICGKILETSLVSINEDFCEGKLI